MLKNRLFLKFFFSMMSVIVLTVVLSIAVERYVVKNQSQQRITETIEALIKFRDELANLLIDDETTAAAELLLASPQYQEQFFIFDMYDNEILGRENTLSSPPPSHFDHTLSQNFLRLDIPLDITVTSILNQPYMIEMRPKMVFHAFFSPRLAGVLIRFVLLLLFCGLVCYLLAWRFTRSIKQLRDATQKIAAGEYEAFADNMKFSKDELGQLGKDFQYMSKQLNESMALRKQMLSDISHELRSPLARMQVALEITKNKHPHISDALARIEKESNRMSQLIEQILMIQKAQAEQESQTFTRIDSYSLLLHIIKDVRYEYQQTNKKIQLIALENSPSIYGDYLGLHSALENVVRNAMAHTAENTSVSVIMEQNKDSLFITINDAGNGVAEDKLTAIFQPFTRLDSSRNRSTGGYGLGLSISHTIIDHHQGRITANNRRNAAQQISGLSVIVQLPIISV